MFRSDLTDEQWRRIQPVLPPQKPKTGRPALDHRSMVNAILYVQREGVAWRQLPTRFGPWSTAASRYYRWKRAGVWDRVDAALTYDLALRGELHHSSPVNGVHAPVLESVPS
jgi:transposase